MISLIALTLSLMGVGYAAITLPRDSVGKAQIKAGAVGSQEVANGSLQPVDFSKAAIAQLTGATGAKGDTGTRGEAGARGEAGPQGQAGSGGGTGLNVTGSDGTVVGEFVSWGFTTGTVTVKLPSGLLALYERSGQSTWQRNNGGVYVKSTAADCSASGPRYVAPSEADNLPRGYVYWDNHLQWAFTIGTTYDTLPSGTHIYAYFAGQCTDQGLATGMQWVPVQAAAAPPLLFTPVTIG